MAKIHGLFYGWPVRIRRDLVQTWLLLVALLLVSGTARAQGTMTYLSNLDQASAGSLAVGSDSWLATIFKTGTNAGGYSLDSVQLAIADASGNPHNFLVMLYSMPYDTAFGIGSPLETLDGSLNPATAGDYTFTSISNSLLSPKTLYCVVLTAGTTVADGAYNWSEVGMNTGGEASGGWGGLGGIWTSSNGSSWSSPTPVNPQLAINATAIHEPAELALAALGASFLGLRRWIDSTRRGR